MLKRYENVDMEGVNNSTTEESELFSSHADPDTDHQHHYRHNSHHNSHHNTHPSLFIYSLFSEAVTIIKKKTSKFFSKLNRKKS
jgi:hypothetical protein